MKLQERSFLLATREALQGKHSGLFAPSHREAVRSFSNYVDWLAQFQHIPDFKTNIGTLTVRFSDGGYVRFFSMPHRSDGLTVIFDALEDA